MSGNNSDQSPKTTNATGSLPHIPNREPARLFKYMKREHLDAALRRGQFRIGTLLEYRNIERFGVQVGDTGEGTRSVNLTATTPISFNLMSEDPRAVHARKVFKGWDQFPPGSQLIINMQEHSSLVLHEHSEDVFVYSTSMCYDAEQKQAFGYDACLEILDPEGFFAELSNTLPDADFVIGADVQYRDRKTDLLESGVAPPAFIKPLEYSRQREFRVVWQSRKQPIQPIVLDCPRALQYCAEYI